MMIDSITLQRISRLLSTSAGTDKVLMLIQYVALLLSKLDSQSLKLIPAQSSSRRLSQRFGALSGLISETRTTLRLLDLFSVFQWWKSLKPSQNSFKSRLLDFERLEVISMMFFYPVGHLLLLLLFVSSENLKQYNLSGFKLEYIYFLTRKDILPCSPRTAAKASLYSCRAWAAYTLLHFGYLWNSFQDLRQQQIHHESQGNQKQDKVDVKARRAALLNGLVVNLAFAPLTLHWSLEKGLYRSESITAICGAIAALGQLRAAWKAS